MDRTGKYTLVAAVAVLLLYAAWYVGKIHGQQFTEEKLRPAPYSSIGQLPDKPVQPLSGDKLHHVLSMIESDYIDPISHDSLVELSIPAILHKLDPHSVYLPPKEFEQADEYLQGEFSSQTRGVLLRSQGLQGDRRQAE